MNNELVKEEKKKIAAKINTSLQNDTRFMYFEGLSYAPCPNVKYVSKNDFEFKRVSGTYFTVEDAFILSGVHTLGYATVETLYVWLKLEKLKYPKKSIPDFDIKRLHTRMVFLVKQGVLTEYDYITQKKEVVHVFVCPAYGHLYFRTRLDTFSAYDQSAVFRSEMEILKRLAVNEVALSFAKNKNFNDIRINCRSVEGTNNLGYIYALVDMKNEDGEKERFLIEPAYFSFDSHIMTVDELLEKNNTRLDKVIEIYENLNNEVPTRMIFCVENMDGMKKFLQMIKSRDLDFFKKAFYTSENVVTRCGKELNCSLLTLDYNNGKPCLYPLVNYWAFK